VVTAAVEGISFPLEREEAVEIWATGAVAGVKASEAAGFGLLVQVLAFLDGGSMKPSSLQEWELTKRKSNTDGRHQNLILEKVVRTYKS
jgi:hypothetical protein